MSIRIAARDGQKPLRPTPRPSHARRRQPSRATTSALVPAAARTPTHLNPVESDLAAAAIDSFTTAVGGRAKLLATLAIADADTTSDKVVNCLLDPEYATWSLRRICAYAGITVADLFASYKKALFVQAHIDAAHRITSQLPPIVDDVMRRALPMPQICPRCEGAPTTPGTSPCPACRGEGSILSEPDLDRQKLALELGHLTERKAGIVMQQNQIAAPTSHLTVNATGTLEQLQQAVGDLLFAPGRVRAASPHRTTVVDPREPPPPQEDPRQLDLPLPRQEPGDAPEDTEDEADDPDDAPLQT